MEPKVIAKGIYLVGGAEMTDARDCSVYLVDCGDLVLIDTGAGKSIKGIVRNIDRLGLAGKKMAMIVLTHRHIDHVGGARELRDRYDCPLVIHEQDAGALESGDMVSTGAGAYGVNFDRVVIDIKLTKEEERLHIGNQTITCLHTPGHTPGSISCYLDRGGKRILFGQDIHGPFLHQSGANMSDWRESMYKLLSLKADILCEGHFGVYEPAEKVVDYITGYLQEYGE